MDFAVMVPGAEGAGWLDVISPYDGLLLGRVAQIDAKGVDQALSTAQRLFDDRSAWISAERRIEILGRTLGLMHTYRDDLVEIAVREGGKPLADTQAEVVRAIDSIRSCIECMRTESGREIPMGLNAASMGKLAMTRREPIGPVVSISAFNHPLNLIVHQVGPAIAAGCPVIVKPAAETPLSCFRFVELLREAGMPDEWVQPVAVTSVDVASKLATDPRVAFLSFIGSAKVGWGLRSKLAPGTRCALEHGGVAPVIVAPDADLDMALPKIAKGGFYHAGQVCVSVQRVFAHRSIVQKVADGLAETAKSLKVGDPFDANTDVGPLIRHRELDRIHEWVQEPLSAGGKLLCGGKKLSNSLYAPTVLLDPPRGARVSRLEIFGPVICVYAYDDLDEAIKRANDLPYAFQAAVMTRDIDTAMRCYKNLSAAAVMVNDHTAFRVDWMPFAGLKQSGLGVGGIPYTYHEMQIEKLLVLNSAGL